jgi:hypothetical protein
MILGESMMEGARKTWDDLIGKKGWTWIVGPAELQSHRA